MSLEGLRGDAPVVGVDNDMLLESQNTSEALDKTPGVVDLGKLQIVIGAFEKLLLSGKLEIPQNESDKVILMRKVNLLLIRFLEELGMDHARNILSLVTADPQHLCVIEKDTNMAISPSPQYALANMRRMFTLEKNEPGSVRYLYDHRGIRNFSRFSTDFWKRQYVEADEHLPYMLVIIPSGIVKNALTEGRIYAELQDSLWDLPRPHLARVIETDGVVDLFRLLTRLDKTYNALGRNPITLVLYDGHGTSERLFLTGNGDSYTFGKRHIVDNARFDDLFKKHMPKMFAKNAQFVFGSCEAAANENAVAYEFKKTLERIFSKSIRVVGAEKNAASFSKITPSLKRNGVLAITCESNLAVDKSGKIVAPKYKAL